MKHVRRSGNAVDRGQRLGTRESRRRWVHEGVAVIVLKGDTGQVCIFSSMRDRSEYAETYRILAPLDLLLPRLPSSGSTDTDTRLLPAVAGTTCPYDDAIEDLLALGLS